MLEVADLLEERAMRAGGVSRRLLFAEAALLMQKASRQRGIPRDVRDICLWRIARCVSDSLRAKCMN